MTLGDAVRYVEQLPFLADYTLVKLLACLTV